MKEKSQALIIILPCYNEEANIELLVKQIDRSCLHLNYTIIAIDDGSQDQTEKILSRLRRDFSIVLLKHPTNLGLQAALRSGIQKALQITTSENAIVVMDADVTHNPYYIPTMITCFNASFDIVIGSRYVKSGRQLGVPFHRRVLSRGINIFLKSLFRLPVKDITSGYRCYKANILRKMVDKYGPDFIESRGFEVAFELLAKARKLNAKITEIPIILDYSRKKGRSKLRIQKTIFNYMTLIIKLLK